jgi:hypothetical protein
MRQIDRKVIAKALDVLEGLVRDFWPYVANRLERERDEVVDDVLRQVVERDLVAALDEELDDRQREVLRAYACGAAGRAVEKNDEDLLVLGLVALSLAGAGDSTDVTDYYLLFGRSARKMKLAREEIFERAARRVGEKARESLREYVRTAPVETARRVRRYGYREMRDEKGFRYEYDVSKSPWF